MFQNSISGVDSDLVVSFVSVLDAQIIVFEIDVDIGYNESVPD